MSNKEIFNSGCFDLPIKSDCYFLDSLKSTFEEFLKLIETFDGEIQVKLTPNITAITQQCESIVNCVETFLKGFPGNAYFILKNCLDELNKESLLEIQHSLSKTEKGHLFRLRQDHKSQLTRNEIFHIPFQLRERVATQRYSIPGLPCLYLGDSVFVCWEELDRPSFSTIHASRFDLSISEFKFLDLNITTNEMRKRCFPGNKEKFMPHLVKFLSYWPLLAACSFIVRKPGEVFKPEYIVPQLLLQWVVDTQGVDGIKYKSNRIKGGPNNVGSFTNVVIPVKEIASDGYCKILKKKIKLTSPVSWPLIHAADPTQEFISKTKEDINIEELRRASFIEIIDGEKTSYSTSIFGTIEEKLNRMTASLITGH